MIRRHSSLLFLVLILLLVIFLFHKFLFSLSPISSVDYSQLNSPTIQYLKAYSFSGWYPSDKLGVNYVVLLNHAPANFLVGLLGSSRLPGPAVERILWWIPFFLLGGFSIYLLSNSFKENQFAPLSIIVYLTNTYILLLLAGGQIQGVGLAYALAPLLLVSLENIFSQVQNAQFPLGLTMAYGLLFGVQMVLDPRLTYISLFISLVYGVIYLLYVRINAKFLFNMVIFGYVLPCIILGLLHVFWIVPTVLSHESISSDFGSVFTSVNAVQYFSFAKFENTLGLLHPNWPENIFGLTHFMRPEFLLLPIFAFGSLLFVKKAKDKAEQQRNIQVLFFALLGIIGIFLAKGAQDPFGGIYVWIFDHVPGFVMFRDPTKWYLLTAISYSVLIPFTLCKIYELLKSKVHWLQEGNVGIIFIGFLLFLIRPAVFGQLPGTFQKNVTPWEYQKLATDLQKDSSFGRVLWVPVPQRYTFYSVLHSRVSASELFNETSLTDILHVFAKPATQTFLQDAGVKYVVVPYDSEKEIFLTDRKYDRQQYKQAVSYLKKISWLKQINGYGQLAIFVVTNPKDHFWASDTNATVSYHFVSPTEYTVSVQNARKGDRLIFGESYNSHWILKGSTISITSKRFEKQLNSFVLPEDGNFVGQVVFTPQQLINISLWVSSLTVIGILGYLVASSKRKGK